MYKVVNVDIDPINQKSEREEWGTAKYHGNYNPTAAFEMELQFLVATGAIVGDLVSALISAILFIPRTGLDVQSMPKETHI